MTKLKTTIRLRGLRKVTLSYQPRVWLNDKFLSLKDSLKVQNLSDKGFDWGNTGAGASQFALAVCLELYPPEVARQVWQQFAKEFIAPIQEDGFDVTLDLKGFHEKYLRDLVGEWEEDVGRT